MTQTIINLGTGGAALNARNGSTTGADTNDALFLDWPGDNTGDYVYVPGVAGNFMSVPDAAALDITGDIDIRVRVAMDDWTPSAATRLVSKLLSPNISYEFSVLTTGLLSFTYSTDGTTAISRNSTTANAFTDGTNHWVRVTLDADNGASGHDVQFFTSSDGVNWVQLGATVTNAGTVTLFSGAANIGIGSRSGGAVGLLAGKVYRAQILNGIGGTTVLDVDTSVITSGSATSFTALTGQTVTINRSTAGRKSVAVVSPVWLFGTDDFMQASDNPLLNFEATDSMTLVIVARQWATATGGRLLAKSTAMSAGWTLLNNATVLAQFIDDAGVTENVSGSFTSGVLHTISVARSVADDSFFGYIDSTLTDTEADDSTGSFVNALPMRVGAQDNGAFGDFEFIAAAVFRRALTATEIAAITVYYQNRLS